MSISFQQLLADIIKIGIKENDVVALHSSFSSIGDVENGPETVLEAFLRAVGEGGTIMAPTFTYSLKCFGNRVLPFHVEKTPSQTGIISEILRKRAGALRSLHPTHSVVAYGFFAKEMVKDHHKTTALGRNSPFHKLARMGGVMLLIGVGQEGNFLLHTAESLANVPYLTVSFTDNQTGMETALILENDGTIREVQLYEIPGCSRGFYKAEPVLRARGVLEETFIGKAKTFVMKAENVLEVIVEKLEEDPFFLLCDNPTCKICPKRKKIGKMRLKM